MGRRGLDGARMSPKFLLFSKAVIISKFLNFSLPAIIHYQVLASLLFSGVYCMTMGSKLDLFRPFLDLDIILLSQIPFL